MKRLTTLLLVLLDAIVPGLLATSCTHNNGDIGPLFGQWKVTAMAGDGVELPPYEGNMFWSFQSQTMEIRVMTGNHESMTAFGNWSREGDMLSLDYPDADRQPPAASHLPAQCRLEILKLDSGNAIFLYRLPEGGTITYTLRKW